MEPGNYHSVKFCNGTDITPISLQASKVVKQRIVFDPVRVCLCVCVCVSVGVCAITGMLLIRNSCNW